MRTKQKRPEEARHPQCRIPLSHPSPVLQYSHDIDKNKSEIDILSECLALSCSPRLAYLEGATRMTDISKPLEYYTEA